MPQNKVAVRRTTSCHRISARKRAFFLRQEVHLGKLRQNAQVLVIRSWSKSTNLNAAWSIAATFFGSNIPSRCRRLTVDAKAFRSFVHAIESNELFSAVTAKLTQQLTCEPAFRYHVSLISHTVRAQLIADNKPKTYAWVWAQQNDDRHVAA